MSKPVREVSPAVPGAPPVGKKKPGRPSGSRDVRPILLKAINRYRLFPLLFAELDRARSYLTEKELLYFYLEMAKIGISACPRNVSVDVAQTRLLIDPSLGAVPRIPLTRKRIVGELPPGVEADEEPSQFSDYRLVGTGESSSGEEEVE